MQFLVGKNRQLGLQKLDFDPIKLSDFISQCQRFRELVSCIQIEYPSLGTDPGKHFQDGHSFGPKGCCHCELIAITLDSPLEYFLRSG